MTLKAIIPPGQAELTVNGLHQWDYGQKLEIHSSDLPAVVEVHFACAGMKEAVVRVCEAVDGVATATIPDKCLEQTTPITAWVFEIDDTAGFTTKTITLPVIPRTKPQPGESVPEEYTDKYTQAVTAMNEAVEKVASGEVKAGYAYEANHATSADSATTASTATVADHATAATSADSAAGVSTTSKALDLTWSGESASADVELDANSTYLFTVPSGSLGLTMTIVIHVLEGIGTGGSSLYQNWNLELYYNQSTKKLFLRKYYFVADEVNGVGYSNTTGTTTVTYAKIASITPEEVTE